MTPPARLSAAIEVLDLYLGGQPVEKALTNWGRRSRYAGSKDRAAVRDIVFDCLRRRSSCAARGGSLTGRGLVLGALKGQISRGELEQAMLAELFCGEGHAPAALNAAEAAMSQASLSTAEALDMPDWLISELDRSFPTEAARNATCDALTSRAEVFLRVNLSRISRADAIKRLSAEDIFTVPHDLAPACLRVTKNPRRVAQSKMYQEGFVELQDAASQALCAGLPNAGRMLDYCAGGGGKVLAYGDRVKARLFAHDANPARMRDLPPRAARAGLDVTLLDGQGCQNEAPFDLVLCDVPCSGSGAWRRSPEGKWALTAEKLQELTQSQSRILNATAPLVSANGTLAFATCSVLAVENTAQIQSFVARHSQFQLTYERQYLPTDGGDGFYIAHLTRAQ